MAPRDREALANSRSTLDSRLTLGGLANTGDHYVNKALESVVIEAVMTRCVATAADQREDVGR